MVLAAVAGGLRQLLSAAARMSKVSSSARW